MAEFKTITWLNLQLFAEDEDGKGGEQDKADQDKDDKKDEKTFTQSELDAIIAKRIKRIESKTKEEFEGSEEYKKYTEYQQNKLTEDEKLKEQLKALETTQQENALLKAQLEDSTNLTKLKDIDEEFKEFVFDKIKKGVTKDKDFEDVLKDFLAEETNNKYLLSSNEDDNKFKTGKRHKGGKAENAKLDLMRRAAGIKVD